MDRSKLILLAVVVACGIASPFLSGINPYYYDILIGIGINIILAAGLNLVNGYTGQFSLGHAGFMAAGAYASAWLTLSYGYSLGTSVFATTAAFVIALLLGGVVAALSGLIVGVPSLRLKGDYLAIVTLGFNEIIKGVIQNAEPLGAQRGLGGMVQHTTFFLTFAFAASGALLVVVSLRYWAPIIAIGAIGGMIAARLHFARRKRARIAHDQFVRIAEQLGGGLVIGKLGAQKTFVRSVLEQPPNEIRHSREQLADR